MLVVWLHGKTSRKNEFFGLGKLLACKGSEVKKFYDLRDDLGGEKSPKSFVIMCIERVGSSSNKQRVKLCN
jgi:hypothetical protein